MGPNTPPAHSNGVNIGSRHNTPPTDTPLTSKYTPTNEAVFDYCATNSSEHKQSTTYTATCNLGNSGGHENWEQDPKQQIAHLQHVNEVLKKENLKLKAQLEQMQGIIQEPFKGGDFSYGLDSLRREMFSTWHRMDSRLMELENKSPWATIDKQATDVEALKVTVKKLECQVKHLEEKLKTDH